MNNNHTITLTNSNSVFVQTKLEQASLVTKEDKKLRICASLIVHVLADD